jgi:hypothetical protein
LESRAPEGLVERSRSRGGGRASRQREGPGR